MDKEFVIRYIKEKNYWWKDRAIREEDKGILRESFVKRVFASFTLERIVCLVGIRRAGKTTIMYQIADRLLQDKSKKPQHVVYVKLDDLSKAVDDIRDIASVYYELTGINPKIEEVFFFIDEIHFLKNWQLQLKYFIDAHYKSKFIISGSSKTLLYKNASESLAGRITFIDIFPLSFREFLEFQKVKLSLPNSKIGGLLNYKNLTKAYRDLLTEKEKIVHFLNQYLEVGGFPEWFKVKNVLTWRKELLDYFSLIIFKDIVSVFKVKDPILLEKLAREIAMLSAERFSYLNLSNKLDADRETIKLYLYYLKSSALIFIAESYSKTKRAKERKEKKIYLWEEGLRKALTLDPSVGRAIENIIAEHLVRTGYKSKIFFEPYYWKNNFEVDFVYDDSKEIIPIEIKYQTEIKKEDLRGLIEFMEKFKIKKGVIITKDLLDNKKYYRKNILYVPAWLFLIYCEE